VKKAVLILLVLGHLILPTTSFGGCSDCGGAPEERELPYPSCLEEVELIIHNSLAYGPEDLKKILPFVNRASEAFYRCGKFEIATGNGITVIVDSREGVVYLTRYPFTPQER
jgi:hypothetical protein